MKTKLSPVFIIVFFCCIAGSAPAQDAMYSQPFANPLYLNPAFAGLANSQRLGIAGLNFHEE